MTETQNASDDIRTEILREAAGLISGERAQTYGSAAESFARVARAWSAVLGWEVTPEQVPVAMLLLKACRAQVSPGVRDHWVDIAGYAALAGEVSLQPSNDMKVSERDLHGPSTHTTGEQT